MSFLFEFFRLVLSDPKLTKLTDYTSKTTLLVVRLKEDGLVLFGALSPPSGVSVVRGSLLQQFNHLLLPVLGDHGVEVHPKSQGFQNCQLWCEEVLGEFQIESSNPDAFEIW